MNVYNVLAYLLHLIKSRGSAGHGVHSPFIYDFLTTVVRNKTSVAVVKQVENLRREMLSDDRVISVTDLGAGSLKKRSNERKVSEIASTSALPPRQLALLARMAGGLGHRAQGMGHGAQGEEHRAQGKEHRAQGTEHIAQGTERQSKAYIEQVEMGGIILELGTSLGISALAMALAAPEHKIVTVEGCPELAALATSNLKRHGAENAAVLNAEFSDALEDIQKDGQRPVFAFIDGNHSGEALESYVSTIAAMGRDVIIVADDIHLSRDMHQAWNRIAGNDLYPVTMETGRFGIIFMRKGLTPGRYRIRC